jgi:hypothetical protein
MELWHVILALAGVAIPVVLAAMARDRSLISMINRSEGVLNSRIDRVRDEYVREDHLRDHLARIDKRFDETSENIRRSSEKIETRLTEVVRLLNGRGIS